jgi:sugar phosphate permease
MNTRLLGIFCIAGSLIAVVGALLFRLRYDSAATGMGVVIGTLMSLGIMAGLIGLIQLNAVGSNPVARALAFLPIIGLVFASVGQVASRASGMSSPDSVLSIIGFVGFFGFLAGLVLVSILTIAAKTWSGWRRFVPLFITVMFFIGLGFRVDNIYLSHAVSVAPMALLGYVVATAERAPSPAESVTA